MTADSPETVWIWSLKILKKKLRTNESNQWLKRNRRQKSWKSEKYMHKAFYTTCFMCNADYRSENLQILACLGILNTLSYPFWCASVTYQDRLTASHVSTILAWCRRSLRTKKVLLGWLKRSGERDRVEETGGNTGRKKHAPSCTFSLPTPCWKRRFDVYVTLALDHRGLTFVFCWHVW